jgi:hypothetical protein
MAGKLTGRSEVSVSLPASQRRILEKIEYALRGSDPRLTAMFAIFSRLTRDEEIPRVEQLRARAELPLVRRRGPLPAVSRAPQVISPARPVALLFFPLAFLVVVSAFIMAMALPSSPRCAPVAAGPAWHGIQVRKSKDCAAPLGIFAR